VTADLHCICLALLLFLVFAAEDNDTTSSSHLQQVVLELSTSFRNTPLYYWRSGPEALLWTLSLGAFAAKGLAVTQDRGLESGLLVGHLKNAAMQTFGNLPVPTAQMVEKMEKTGLLIPSIFNARAETLWSSVGICPARVTEVDGEDSSAGEQSA
jgi:hypothetical protein